MIDELSAGAVVFYLSNTPEFLLLHYPAGHWDFPKGNVEFGEAPEEAALREIKEETGLDAELVPGFREEIEYFYVKAGRRVRKKVILFLARAFSKEVKLSWEHVGYVWLPYSQALAKVTYPNSRQVLAKAHKYLLQSLKKGDQG
ncbi:MAG: bis(5'-nucleosyl)-tetraphosphatase [Pyrobaculum sp.]